MATVIELIDRARDLLNEPLDSTRTFPDDSSSFFKDTTLRRYLNISIEEVGNEIIAAGEGFFETQAFLDITAGTSHYTLPSGIVKIKRVEDVRAGLDSRPVEINPVTINHREEGFYTNIIPANHANSYYLAGDSIVLTSTPSFTNASAIRIHYVKKPGEVSGGTETTPIPTNHEGILVYGTLKQALFQMQADTTKADLEYEKRLSKLRKQVEQRQVQRPRRVRNTYGDIDQGV